MPTTEYEKVRKLLGREIDVNPNILSGEPVFAGTRVPIQALVDYIKNSRFEEFLRQFPSVSREQAATVLYTALSLAIDNKNSNASFT